MQPDTCNPTRSSCPGASREEQQVLGAHEFPIPVKHGSRNGRIKQETPQTIDKTETMLTITRRVVHLMFRSRKGRAAECRRSGNLATGLPASESSQQGGHQVCKPPKRNPEAKTTHPDCANDQNSPHKGQWGKHRSWRKIHPDRSLRKKEKTLKSRHTSTT